MTKTKTAERREAKLHIDLAFYATGGVPSQGELAAVPCLQRWHVVLTSAYGANQLSIRGKVYGDKTVADGTDFTSRAVLWFDRKYRFIRCINSLYRLGVNVGHQETESDIPLERLEIP